MKLVTDDGKEIGIELKKLDLKPESILSVHFDLDCNVTDVIPHYAIEKFVKEKLKEELGIKNRILFSINGEKYSVQENK